MRFTHLYAENWRNFRRVDVALEQRVFIVGPNASGKSNLLDVFRFLRDIAEPGGGLRRAVEQPRRRDVSHIRSLFARRRSNVVLQVRADLGDGAEWDYRLEVGEDTRRTPVVRAERVRHGAEILLRRPDGQDQQDPSRLLQTHLEQVNSNLAFRGLAEFLGSTRYLHVVPQLMREPGKHMESADDPYGAHFLLSLTRTNARTLGARFKRIQSALAVAVPQLRELRLERDEAGVPHLEGRYEHWRPNAGWQREDQFSDGTLRLVGLLWSLLDGAGPLLLEEPELSLHPAVVRRLPSAMWRADKSRKRQVLVSTHSPDLLQDEGIAAEEVLLLRPAEEGTAVVAGSTSDEVRAMLEAGLTVADAVLPLASPPQAVQLGLFGE